MECEVIEIEDKLSNSSLYMSNPEEFDKLSRKHANLKTKIDESELQLLEIYELQDSI